MRSALCHRGDSTCPSDASYVTIQLCGNTRCGICRCQHGEDYSEAKCAIHIGILDFTLFKECPEFYASYKMMNVKNHHVLIRSKH